MKISREAWDLKEECFGPLLPYVKDQQVTDINYNGVFYSVFRTGKGLMLSNEK